MDPWATSTCFSPRTCAPLIHLPPLRRQRWRRRLARGRDDEEGHGLRGERDWGILFVLNVMGLGLADEGIGWSRWVRTRSGNVFHPRKTYPVIVNVKDLTGH